MNVKVGTVTHSSFPGNVCFKFSVLCVFSANQTGRLQKGYKQTEAKLYIPVKARSDTGAAIHYPAKASDDLKMGNCILLPYISGSFLPIPLIIKD
jgi:hypothetical protein